MSSSGSVPDVALRPRAAPKQEKLSPVDVLAQVEQLTHERGFLRNITEKSLQDEIDENDVPEHDMEGIEGGEEKEVVTKEEREKELKLARFKMFQKVEMARFHANGALDLIALVLAKDPKKAVNSSFSDQLKALSIPNGSIAIAKEVERPKDHIDVQWKLFKDERARLVDRGARMHALEGATDHILKAATQLETEVRKEVKYWDEVLSVSQKGWPLQRLPKKKAFGVRYGVPGASNKFKARGIAPLQMDEDGSIILDPALSLQPKTLRVRISDNGITTGSSSLPARKSETDFAIEESIQLARDSLFEEELYHEISMETRQLQVFGVELRDSVIHLVAPASSHQSSHRKILIDLISRDEDEPVGDEDHTNDWLAQTVAEGLRLLLAHEHRMRLYRKSRIPQPLTLQKRQAQSPPLLRSLLAIISHISCIDSLHEYLDAMANTLNSAGLDVSLQMSRETSWEALTKIIGDSAKKSLPPLDQILEFFVKPLDGVATLSLPSSHGSAPDNLTIAARTLFGPQIYGTEYKVTIPSSLASILHLREERNLHWAQRDFLFSSADDLKCYVDWLLCLDLSQALLPKKYLKDASIRSKEPRVTINVKEGKKVFKKEVAVQFEDGTLAVKVSTGPFPGADWLPQEYTWTGNDGEPSFLKKVQSLLNN